MVARDQQRNEIERLLAEGLDLFGRNRVDEAVQCWQQVLTLDPDEPRARDFLESAKPAAQIIPLRPEMKPDVDLREALKDLVRDRRFEDAYQLLMKARADAPEDPGLGKSLRLIKERLMHEYINTLGDLDATPTLAPDVRLSELSVEGQVIVKLVDGHATLDEILVASKLGQFRTLRTLAQLAQAQLLSLSPPTKHKARAEAVERMLDEPTSVHALTRPPTAEIIISLVKAAATPQPAEIPAVAPAATPVADPYEEKFKAATRAYLMRDYAAAKRLFQECLDERPGDTRAKHNLETLSKRKDLT